MSTTGNKNRTAERLKCRRTISSYLKNSLNVDVEPSDVRTIPNPSDTYEWRWTDDQAHLFSSHLSKFSTSKYTQLSNAISNGTVWAVKKGNNSPQLFKDSTISHIIAQKNAQIRESNARSMGLQFKLQGLFKVVKAQALREERYRRIISQNLLHAVKERQRLDTGLNFSN